jgi:hypothetical protein
MTEVEVVIKSKFLEFPIYISIETEKSSKIYTSLCLLRNKLIENSIIEKEMRYKLYFYKKKENNFIKIKENDILDGIIFLNIEDELDYSEPVNILFYLEKRITEFEKEFNKLNELNDYTKLKNIWSQFRDRNSDCFDYAEWYSIMEPIRGINLLYKMSLDVRKWIIQKERIISDIDLKLLNSITITEKNSEYDIINKFLI